MQLQHNLIRIRSESMLSVLASAIVGGGLGKADHFINVHVSKDYDCSYPERDMENIIQSHGYPAAGTIGLMTAAYLQNASVQEACGERFGLVVCTTAGVGNAARAGMPRPVYAAYKTGTINIMIFVQGAMTDSALVEAAVAATEAKAAALHDLQVMDANTGLIATGTTSDAIVIGSSPQYFADAVHLHAGTATALGNAIGRAVYDSVKESVEAIRAMQRGTKS
ncbi:hypothetical protein EYB31_15500 [Paenibacillus thalictri]|uniref:Adenosylcobinamide amidohydrolase n=2 Tax=Paenibacillus thalictri TaxID=2527873 RepID=A0A4Q9DSI5_9BACL|nr:hypothetical protein EYB31_15500 [Paenibacillus thalictri]